MIMDKLEDIERLLYEKEDNKKDTVSEKNNKHKKEDKVVNKIPESYLTPGYQKTVQVGIKKLYPDVVAPEYKHDGDACCDIRAYRVVKMMNDMGVKILSRLLLVEIIRWR